LQSLMLDGNICFDVSANLEMECGFGCFNWR
jgi:hypothetical protein